jgi:phosphate/sulfate permease
MHSNVLVALALGLGTMVGWKRIVVTVGEKIGKSHLTYAQGASADQSFQLTGSFDRTYSYLFFVLSKVSRMAKNAGAGA